MKWMILSWVLMVMYAPSAEMPNILWITAEDYSADWLGCYGNPQAQTPRIDRLAEQGVLFTHAYSNAAVCAVARSTILNGAYAPTQGTQHMRSRKPIPSRYKPYVTYLREMGYYCTNAGKTDYNYTVDDASLWDACGWSGPHYKNRPAGKPFFAVINLGMTHESSLFPQKIARNRKLGLIPKSPRIPLEKVLVPPYLPDLPGIRHDIAVYHDNMTAMDRQVGALIDELKKRGLAEDTIIFHYSDHGGILPRGKRYLTDTGVRVSMVVYFPKKWQHLSPFKPGQRVDEPVSFVDLAPTLLSLLGVEKPAQMQGRAFLGSRREEPQKGEMEFLYADRFDEIYGMRRGLTDGRWKYIRRFTPQLPASPYSYYQFGQAGWQAWEKAWKDGGLSPYFQTIWKEDQVVEELYDTQSDPWEVKNLAQDPQYMDRMSLMRARLRQKMIETHDTGLVPEGMWAELAPGKPIADYLGSREEGSLAQLVDLAFLASAREEKDIDLFRKKMASSDPLTRYWATHGCVVLGKKASAAEPELTRLLKDTSSVIRTTAAYALGRIGKRKQGVQALVAELKKTQEEFAQLTALNALIQLKAFDQIPKDWLEHTIKTAKRKNYVRRCVERKRAHEGSPSQGD